jgi:[acyl-carrier-protein] S-malonyltransferase
VANVSAEIIKEASVIRDALIKQVSSSVRWEESVTNMIEQGVNTFVEVGPGKVLSGLIKKINKEVTLYHVEDVASLENLLANLKEVG